MHSNAHPCRPMRYPRARAHSCRSLQSSLQTYLFLHNLCICDSPRDIDPFTGSMSLLGRFCFPRQKCTWAGVCTGAFISHRVFVKSFFISQLSHKSVNLSFPITNIKNELTNLCGNCHVQNYYINTFCEIDIPLHPDPTRVVSL